MSSILKALKKLEEEKISQDDDGRRLNVSSEILRQRRSAGSNPWLLRGFAALAVAVIIILTFLLLSRPTDKIASSQQPPASMTPTLPQQPVQLPQPALQTQLQPQAQHLPAQPAGPLPATGAKAAKGQLQEVKIQPEPARAATSQRMPFPELPGNEAVPVQPAPPKSPAKQSTPAAETPDTHMTLSGIAWNKDSSERLAIINGQPATTGSLVSGAIVEEILPDRVRLSSKGRVFELSIGRPGK